MGGESLFFVGLPKSGKTTFAYELALAVAKGTPFLGTPTRQGGVLIIAVEEHLDDVAARLRTLGMSKTDPIGVIVPPIADSPETFRKLRDEIKKRRARLVILDSLSTFWSVDNESASAQVNRWFRQIVDVARETGATRLIIHHERKAGGSGGVKREQARRRKT